MRTVLELDDRIVALLEDEATRQGKTISELAESAIRHFLGSGQKKTELPELPTFRSGGALVNIDSREALHDAMDEPPDSTAGRE
jgi:hypothetical protein